MEDTTLHGDEKIVIDETLKNVTLIALNTQFDVFESHREEGIELFNSCSIRKPSLLNEDDNRWISTVSVTAGKHRVEDEDQATNISATYGMIFVTEDGLSKECRDMCMLVAWNRFSVLFDTISRQMNANLPSLPGQPESVRVWSDSEMDSE